MSAAARNSFCIPISAGLQSEMTVRKGWGHAVVRIDVSQFLTLLYKLLRGVDIRLALLMSESSLVQFLVPPLRNGSAFLAKYIRQRIVREELAECCIRCTILVQVA